MWAKEYTHRVEKLDGLVLVDGEVSLLLRNGLEGLFTHVEVTKVSIRTPQSAAPTTKLPGCSRGSF